MGLASGTCAYDTDAITDVTVTDEKYAGFQKTGLWLGEFGPIFRRYTLELMANAEYHIYAVS